jgi:Ca2+-binding EF-hand superfamily protein
VFGADTETVESVLAFLRRSFQMFDSDRNHVVDQDEFARFCLSYLERLPRDFEARWKGEFCAEGQTQLSFKMFLRAVFVACDLSMLTPLPEIHARPAAKEAAATAPSRPSPSSSSSSSSSPDSLVRLFCAAMESLEKDFARLDASNDGTIDLAEMTQGLKAGSTGELVDKVSDLQRLFTETDVDGSGFIDFSEYVMLVLRLCSESSYVRVFPQASNPASAKRGLMFLRGAFRGAAESSSFGITLQEAAGLCESNFGSVPDKLAAVFADLHGTQREKPPPGGDGAPRLVLREFISLMYAVYAPGGKYVRRPKRLPLRMNPLRKDLPEPAPAKLCDVPRVIPFPTKELKRGRELGKGGFGVVYECDFRGQKVAAKFLTGAFNEATKAEFTKEVSLMEKLVDPTIVYLVGYAANPPELCIVTELCVGSLFDTIHKQGRRLQLSTIVRILTEVATGLSILHSSTPPIIHRDLKSLNVLIDAQQHAKVADFGMSKEHATGGQHTAGVMGTPQWSSPEILRGTSYTVSTDTYSFGVLMWEVTHSKIPYYEEGYASQNAIIAAVLTNNVRPRVSQFCDPRLAKLMQRCWQRDPAARPTMQDILKELKEVE